MNDKYYQEVVLVKLEGALEAAIKVGYDSHFLSEIDHLIATAKANKESEETK